MRIVLNGEERELPAGCTVAELIEAVGAVRARVAVEVNEQVVRRAQHEEHRLEEGDRVELVAFIGGGR